MKTLHTRTVKLKKPVLKRLLKELYKLALKNDPKFHFFYEPELIIRISEEEVLKKVCRKLDREHIDYRIYDYPKPVKDPLNWCYECDQYVLDNLELFIQLYHAHSVLALTLTKKTYRNYIARVQHTAHNTGGYNYNQEGLNLFDWAFDRMMMPYLGYMDNYTKAVKKYVEQK